MKTRLQFSLRTLLLICIALTVVGVVGRRVYLRFFPPPMITLCGFAECDIITGWHLKRFLERDGIHFEYRHTGDVPGPRAGPAHWLCGVDATAHKRVLQWIESAVKASSPTVVLTDNP